jgi:hypothetical protein
MPLIGNTMTSPEQQHVRQRHRVISQSHSQKLYHFNVLG